MLQRWIITSALIFYAAAASTSELSVIQKRLQNPSFSLHSFLLVQKFYSQNDYESVWIQDGRFSHSASRLLELLRHAAEEGLNSADYHEQAIEQILSVPLTNGSQADLEVLLTDAFFTYCHDLAYGRVSPIELGFDWHLQRVEADLVKVLQTALSTNKLEENIMRLLPSASQYRELKLALREYRHLREEGLLKQTLKNDPESSIALIREKLRLLGDLSANNYGKNEVNDQALESAVRAFQQRHGLSTDGILGSATLAALNIPIEDRVHQIIANMERLRWFPDQIPKTLIQVNIPAFQLQVFEEGIPVLSMRTIVGKEDWCSPVFLNSEITAIVINPPWNIPKRIALREVLPLIRKNRNYLQRNHILVFEDSSKGRQIDPNAVDWSTANGGHFPYRLVQTPGKENSLGTVKFEFPNECDCYLHDTPAKEFFAKSKRAFSHGCIRLENASGLAIYLLKDDPAWDPSSFASATDRSVTRRILLLKHIPIYLVYFTAWIENGKIQFRNDLYGQDRLLSKKMDELRNVQHH